MEFGKELATFMILRDTMLFGAFILLVFFNLFAQYNFSLLFLQYNAIKGCLIGNRGVAVGRCRPRSGMHLVAPSSLLGLFSTVIVILLHTPSWIECRHSVKTSGEHCLLPLLPRSPPIWAPVLDHGLCTDSVLSLLLRIALASRLLRSAPSR